MFAAQDGSTPNGKLYVNDVFSTFLYQGNGSTQTINNGIDLAGKGGLVWIKKRSSATFGNNWLQNSETGFSNQMSSNNTGAQTAYNFVTSASSTGFSLVSDANVNGSGETYTSWTFRKSPRFFDVVTYTGNGVAGRQIPHSLGVAPGMIILKRTDSNSDWSVWFSGGITGFELNTTSQRTRAGITGYHTSTYFNPWAVTNSTGVFGDFNTNGATYVAYLFAHDPSADGIIQCGSFTTDASGNATVNLGWEPQYLMFKRTDAAGSWFVYDVMRGWSMGDDAYLSPNSSAAESAANQTNPTATGFATSSLTASATYIYLAIRRPNKPPTTGTEVYNAIARTGTGAAATVMGVGFAPDSAWITSRNLASENRTTFDRLRGDDITLAKNTTAAEGSFADRLCKFGVSMDGVRIGTNNDQNSSPNTYINHFFRRAPGFFDVVCYTGDSVIGRAISHNLSAEPELIITKSRSDATSWFTYCAYAPQVLVLNSTAFANFGNDVTATGSTSFTVTNSTNFNGSNRNYVAYLFASLPGISKVGSYTGNGTSQTINCGFTTGARFILIKRTDSTGDWFTWDSARGISSANDPRLSLNTTAAEVTTDDSVDPDASGFIVNQNTATNINVSGASYIFLSVA